MKTKRIPINVAPTKKEEIERWAKCEGLSTSAYFLTLHNDHVRYAYEHGLPIPENKDLGPLAD